MLREVPARAFRLKKLTATFNILYINLKSSNMKKSLRTLALGAAMLAAGAMSAQDVPTVTQNWFTPVPTTVGDFRSGSGLNGKVYVTSGKDLYAIDETSVTKIFTSTTTLDKGFALDEAGNIVVASAFPTGIYSWMNVQLIKPDGTSTNLTLKKPDNSDWTGARYDNVGRAVGDFCSEEGGVYYISVQNQKYPIPVWIANGEVKTLNQPAYVDFADANSTAYVQPSTPMSEMDENTVFSNYYYYSGNSAWNIYYPGSDFETAETLPRPKTADMPEGWNPQTQPGFDVFDLGGKKYIIRMSGTDVYQSQFLIHDMDGNVIFHTEYTDEWNNIPKAGTASIGSGIWARKVSDYKVELYQVFKCQDAAKSFAAMYTITIPEPQQPEVPEYYVRGDMTGEGWPALEDFKFTRDGENYSWTPAEPVLFSNGQNFKIAEAEWNNATTLSAGDDNVDVNIAAGTEYAVTTHAFGGGNMRMNANINVSNITLTKAENGYTMVVTGTPVVDIPERFLISYDLGSGWDFNHAMTKDGNVFTADFTVIGETGYITFTTAEMNNWTVADGGTRYGSGSTDIFIEPGTPYPLVESSDKCFKMPKGDYTATITVADNGNLLVVFTSSEPIVYQVYFDNSVSQWSNVYVYYWGGSAPAMKWEEAREMTAIDRANNMYTYIFKDGVPANLIFKSDNGQQTKDLEFKNETVYKAVSQDANDGNKWICELGQTGVENVEVDANVPAVYYNLSGVRVANPANGLYIVVRGTKVTKEYIR